MFNHKPPSCSASLNLHPSTLNRLKKRSKKLKKTVDTPLILCDIGATHGNNRTKKQEKI